MKTTSLMFLALLLILSLQARAEAPQSDLAAIETVAGYYMDGGTLGDVELLTKAFHPSARLQFVKEGQYGQWSIQEYLGWAKPGRVVDRETRILAVDLAGNAATVKLELVYPQARFVDYMSLLKIDGRWWIVNKTFFKESF